MQVVTEPSEPGEFRRWVEHFRVPALRVGTFRIVAGGTDDQLWPGSVVFVPAGGVHRFVDVSEELEVLVVFAPAESGG